MLPFDSCDDEARCDASDESGEVSSACWDRELLTDVLR